MKLLFVPILVAEMAAAALSVVAQTEYTTDGLPTALEEEIRWLMNRGRFDATSENQRQGTSFTDIPASSPPVAPHHAITVAARRHSEDMAQNNAFQHDTVEGSAYYDPVTQPTPWDRMRAEGYDYNRAGENIAAGYRSAREAYTGWWRSDGHRRNMYNSALREVGNGYYYRASSEWGRYYTMDLGSINGRHFLTGTLFYDADQDGSYDQGEGVGGIRVRLRVNNALHSDEDVTTEVGSFAIPIGAIDDGATVTLLLANLTTAPVELSIPADSDDYTLVDLAPGAERVFGTFMQPTTVANVGLRDVVPSVAVPPPAVTLVRSGNTVTVSWRGESTAEYMPQGSSDFVSWQDLDTAYRPGAGNDMIHQETLSPSGAAVRVYRVTARPR